MESDTFVVRSLFDFEEAGEPCELLYVPHVCIIESPNDEDRLVGRSEGLAISEALRIAEIRNKVFDVVDRPSFATAFEAIVDFGAPRKFPKVAGERRQCAVPRLFLHFSCHGNEEGIGLTNEDFITWRELGDLIVGMAVKIGLFDRSKFPCANLCVCMSSCCGLHARSMAKDANAVPFLTLVGCKFGIAWTESVTAFNTFYHQVITKERCIPQAVVSINESSLSEQVFELVTAKDVGATGFNDSSLVVVMSADHTGKFRWMTDTTLKRPDIPFLFGKDQIFDEATGVFLDFFDDPEKAVAFMQTNKERPCQVERCAAQEIYIRFAHKF